MAFQRRISSPTLAILLISAATGPTRSPRAGMRPMAGRIANRGVATTPEPLAPEVLASSTTLDDADRKIIGLLQRDGRRPYGAIAEDVGLSEAAVRRRVQRLRDAGVMQIVALTDPLQLGYGREALVGIRVHGDVRLVADKIASIEEVNYVVMTAGSFDLIAEIIA